MNTRTPLRKKLRDLVHRKIAVAQPDNSGGAASYDMSAQSFPSGTMVLVEDANGATANNITITAEGSFVDTDGSAVGQCVINADDGYALLMVAGGVSVLLASKGVDLIP